MATLRNFLYDDEYVVYQTHKHWMVFASAVGWALLGFLFIVQSGPLQKLALFPWILAVGTGVYRYIDYTWTEILVTNLRVFAKTGWVHKTFYFMPYENVQTIKSEQSLIGKLLGYGTLHLIDVKKESVVLKTVADMVQLKHFVQQEVDRLAASIHPDSMSAATDR